MSTLAVVTANHAPSFGAAIFLATMVLWIVVLWVAAGRGKPVDD